MAWDTLWACNTVNSMHLLHSVYFTVTCPGLHHLMFINGARPPPLRLLLHLSLSALTVVNPGTSTLASGVFWVSQVSERHSRLLSLNVLSVLTRAASSSFLLVRQLTFPMIIEGTDGLYFQRLAARLAFTFAPALRPCRLLKRPCRLLERPARADIGSVYGQCQQPSAHHHQQPEEPVQ